MGLVFDRNMEAYKTAYPESFEALTGAFERGQRYSVGVAEVEDRRVLYAELPENSGSRTDDPEQAAKPTNTEEGAGQIQLDSLYDSSFIIDRWCASFDSDYSFKTYIVFGLGNGMFVKELLRRAGKDGDHQVILYEPDTSILKVAFEGFDLTDIISDDNVCLYIEGVSNGLFSVVLDDHIDLKKLQGTRVNLYPNYNVLYPEEYKGFLASVDMNRMIVEGSMGVEVRYGEKYYNNILSNIPNLIRSKALYSLKETVPEGMTAILVSSGPSLSNNIKELKNAVGKCLMIAVDSALPPLFAEDIQPDIYMCVDANKPTTHFQQERTKKSAIVTVMQSIPGAVKEGQAVFFEDPGNDYINAFMEKEGIRLPKVSTGGTVANSAYSLAEFLGASVIIMVGQDLAYTGEKAHADNNLSDNNEIVEATVVQTKDIYGNPVRSSTEFMIYKDWFERRIAENRGHIRTIDATEGGAYIEGSEIMTLKDAISELCVKETDISGAVERCANLFTEEQKNSFIEYIQALPAELRNIASDAKRSIRNYDKMYSMAKQGKLSKGDLTRVLRDNDAISERLDNNPAMSFVEYLIQDAIKNLSENAYKTNKDVKDEIIEASTLGKEHSEAILEKAEWMAGDLEGRSYV